MCSSLDKDTIPASRSSRALWPLSSLHQERRQIPSTSHLLFALIRDLRLLLLVNQPTSPSQQDAIRILTCFSGPLLDATPALWPFPLSAPRVSLSGVEVSFREAGSEASGPSIDHTVLLVPLDSG